MKRYLLLLLTIGASILPSITIQANGSCADSCDTEINSRSYIAIRPPFQSVSPEMVSAFRNDRLHAAEDGKGGAMQFVLFGGKSTKEDRLTRYFMPNGKTSLLVKEQFGVLGANNNPDLLAQNFNIFTNDNNFESRICFEPRYSFVGLGFQWRQSFWQNEEKGRGGFFSVSTPLTRTKTAVNLKEKIINDGGGVDEEASPDAVANMTEAFKQSDWKFGKICKGSMSKTRLADIEVKLGYEWLQHEPCHLESYIGILIPTGNKPNGEFLFEPVVGWGKHVGIMFGSAFGIQVWSDEEKERNLRFEFASHSQYLFRRKQTRSFDLKNKPWSRYQEVYANEEQAQEAAALPEDNPQRVTLSTPGINVFTQCVKVTPGFTFDMNSALVYTCKGFQGEVGYNFFTRRAECVQLACPWKEGPAFKDATGAGQTRPIRDITGNPLLEESTLDTADGMLPVPVGRYEDSLIKEEDLDLQSAATPCLLSYTLYGALGYRWDERKRPPFASLGASYLFSNSNNAVVDRWTVWGKAGFSF
jgi:hypothetical protein